MANNTSRIETQLSKRKIAGNLRSLSIPNNQLIDFSSNDYLGLAKSQELKSRIFEKYQHFNSKNGSTGSRLLTGNSEVAQDTEHTLAQLFGFQRTLVFNSGYAANLGFFSCIPQRGDTIIYDELSHACIKDGSRLSLAKTLVFKHNDLEDLERKIAKSEGQVYIACESVYSMDGDFAPLEALCTLAEKHKAKLVVDEAHSTGIFGSKGNGLVAQLRLTERVYAVIFTFGKGMGIHGACIASDGITIDYLINFSRPFIYTTAPSDFDFISIQEAFAFLDSHSEYIDQLHERIHIFKENLSVEAGSMPFSNSAIQALVISGNDKTRAAAQQLKERGFDVRPILSPTVQEGKERLRICLHAFNSKKEVISLAHELNSLLCS